MDLLRYFRVWLKGSKLMLARDMAYPSQFFLFFIVRIIWGIVGPVFALIIYNVTAGIPGWTFEQLILFYGTFNLSIGIAHVFFLDLTHWIPFEIENGSFDKYLIRPIRLIPLMISNGFSSDGIADMGVGFLLVSYAFMNMGSVSLQGTIIYLILLGLSVFIWLGITLMIIGMSFVFVRTEIIWNIFDTFLEFVRYPLSIYSGGIRFMLSFILPLGIASFYPAMVILDMAVNPLAIIFSAVSSIAFLGLNILILNYGLRKHTSAGG